LKNFAFAGIDAQIENLSFIETQERVINCLPDFDISTLL